MMTQQQASEGEAQLCMNMQDVAIRTVMDVLVDLLVWHLAGQDKMCTKRCVLSWHALSYMAQVAR